MGLLATTRTKRRIAWPIQISFPTGPGTSMEDGLDAISRLKI